MPDKTSITYSCDADGRRIKRTVGSQVTNYLWDEASAYGDVVLETDGSGVTLANYLLAGTQLVSQTRGSSTSYYLQDGQSSTRALTNAAGSVTDTYSYTAFGELLDQTGSTANSYLYTGQQFDSLTGLYDLRARYYDPTLGRFLSQDGYPVNFGNPVELNRYVYTGNNPINRTDPTGQFALTETAIILGGIGAGVGALFGVGQTLACGGNWFINILSGMAFGAAFGVVGAYVPGLALGGGVLLGAHGFLSAIQNVEVNGANKCNIFTATTSMLMAAFSAGGLARGGGGSNLGYPDETVKLNMGHEVSSTGKMQPVNINKGTNVSELLTKWLLAGPGEKTSIQSQLNEITTQRIGGTLEKLGVDLESLPHGQNYNCVSCANIFLPLEKQLPGYGALEDPVLLNALQSKFIEIPNRSSLQTGDIISWHGNGEYGLQTYHVGVYIDGFVFQKLSAIGPYVALTFEEVAPLSPQNSYMQFWRIP